MTTTHDTIATAILGTVPGARRNLTRITVEHAYAPHGHRIRDTWSGSIDGLMDRIDVALEKTTPPGAEVTAAVTTERAAVLTALARALREHPTAGRILDGLDELGEAVVQEDLDAARSWVDGISLLASLPATPDTGLTVYRAEHDSITCGLYTTAAAAQQHCEALISREYPASTTVLFQWCVDEDDQALPGIELDIEVDGEHVSTGYAVTPLEVAAAYDPDADE
ncbi:hypothetical protein ABZS83_32895 [Streptomyces sp. NPDC005426]|uniref:hypothetical protein n=1 Tax=Streptomyces sp. NPDC005426 TaxID=3155344 RepID=UPI0033B5B29E